MSVSKRRATPLNLVAVPSSEDTVKPDAVAANAVDAPPSEPNDVGDTGPD